MNWITPELFWFLLGLVLLIAEFALPGIIIMFFGIGAWITALTTWLGITDSATSQNIVFAFSSVALLFVLRHRMKKIFMGTSTNDGIEDEFTGKEARVKVIIDENDRGKVEIKGAQWNARAQEIIPADTMVVIERREGLTLYVRSR